MAAIHTHGLRRVFGSTVAVDALDLDVAAGEIFGLVGPDGAGKTTTMRMLAGVLIPTAGEAEVAGCNVVRDPEGVKEHIGYMSQRFGLYPDLTVRENIEFYADIYGVGKQERTARRERLLGFSNLTPFQHRLAGDLSGGMKQKLGLACALIHTPRVLLLDEPTNGVDPVSRRDFWRLLYQLVREGVTIFVSTAYLDEAERCNRLVLLHEGRILGAGTPAEVKTLLPGATWEILAERPRAAAAIVRERLSRAVVAVYGDRFHVTASDTDEAGLRALLAEAAVGFSAIRRIEPSLEDVFVGVLAATSSDQPSPPRRASEDAAMNPSAPPVSAKNTAAIVVEVENLERRFGDFRAVAGISFSVRAGEIFGFLGPNGAGKSTTIRMLCGLLAPTGGRGHVAGFDIVRETERIKTRIGYMSQRFSLYDELSVEQNIDFYSGIYCLPKAKKAARKDWVLAMAGLQDHRRARTVDLPGGWKQRLALGCAVLHEPSILFLDEPTSGVDPNSRRLFWDLIYDLAEHGVTVFVTTHYMEESEYCDRLAIIYRGEIVASGTPVELKTRYMTDVVFEIECDRPAEAMAVLEKVPAIKEVALFGAALHAVAADEAGGRRAAEEALTSGGFAIRRFGRITPTLEDVFVSLVEGRDRAGGAVAEVRS